MQGESSRLTQEMEKIVVRFAGDSGDGIQLAGEKFTSEIALAGTDIATLPNYPSEIRAPAGTVAGVSGFQVHLGSTSIETPGDAADVLVALNPAALKANLSDVRPGGMIILNEDAFDPKNLEKAGYSANPCEDPKFQQAYRVYSVPVVRLTREALAASKLTSKEVERCKNFFVLGLLLSLFNRPPQNTLSWIGSKFGKKPELAEGMRQALSAGLSYGAASEVFDVSYVVKKATLKPGTYRNINGSTAMAYGLIAAAYKSGRKLFYGAYPITPASDILHELSHHKRLDMTVFQAEDEIAALCATIGASFAGNLAVTGSSGPGISLKCEALGLGIITELPMVIIDVQRAGPSTGMPTKTEQGDLLQALYGRSGEAPLCVLAASSPENAFFLTYEACRIALKYMTPVFLLADGYLANTTEPWHVPDYDELPEMTLRLADSSDLKDGTYMPYARDQKTLARKWALPGTPGFIHRVGGLEKQDGAGNVSYDAANHQLMCNYRADKIARIAAEISPLKVDGEEGDKLLVLGWGSTEGAIREAVRACRKQGHKVSRLHLHHLNPLPADLGKVLASFPQILLPEGNSGQLRSVLRDRFLRDIKGFNKVTGQPLKISEIEGAIIEALKQQ
jgi:2-oxoglutarate ferredoxin oxidoreductase subunit alpha